MNTTLNDQDSPLTGAPLLLAQHRKAAAGNGNPRQNSTADNTNTLNGHVVIETPEVADEEAFTGNGHSSTSIPPKENKRLRHVLTAAATLVAALAVGVYYVRYIAPYESTDDAFIEGHVTPVAPQVSGRVLHLLVEDNQAVKRGDLLLEIDPRDYEAKLAQAQADLAAAHSQLTQSQAQFAVDQAKAEQERANIVAVEAQASHDKADSKRYQAIGSLGVSQSQIELTDTQARSSAANVAVARNRILAADAQADLSKASIGTAAANVQQNEAAVRQAKLNLSYTKIIASEDGRVTHRTVETGAYVEPGEALLAISPNKAWVVANFKETQLEHMHPNQPVTIEVDAYPHHKFTGHMDSIQSGSGARFSLFPPENATGNYVKVLQRVPVKIVFDDSGLSDPNLILAPGMSVEPKVRVK